MNKITLLGRLTRDVELKESKGIKYVKFSLAVRGVQKNDNGEYNTDFFDCVAWRNNAETISKYCGKGTQLCVSGAMVSNTYTKQDGTTAKTWSVSVYDITLCDAKKDSVASNLEPIELDELNEEDLPF